VYNANLARSWCISYHPLSKLPHHLQWTPTQQLLSERPILKSYKNFPNVLMKDYPDFNWRWWRSQIPATRRRTQKYRAKSLLPHLPRGSIQRRCRSLFGRSLSKVWGYMAKRTIVESTKYALFSGNFKWNSYWKTRRYNSQKEPHMTCGSLDWFEKIPSFPTNWQHTWYC
jgi:hypothetical protein